MFLDQHLVHLMVVATVFIGQIVPGMAFADVLHKLPHEHLPLVEVYQQVTQATVILPAHTALLWIGGEIKRFDLFFIAQLSDLVT